MLAYKFRIYPNKEEERKLIWTKEVCRRTYNRFLELYNNGEHDHRTLRAMLPIWKKTEEDLRGVNAQALQNVLYRLFINLKALRALKNHGRKVGKLRYKSEQRFRSFSYIQFGFKMLPKNDKFGHQRVVCKPTG